VPERAVLRLSITLAAGGLIVAGCTGPDTGAPARQPEPAVSVPAAGTGPAAALPLHRYLPTREQETVSRDAEQAAFRQCMARLKFEIPAGPIAADTTDDQRDRYMLADPAVAQARGYHPDEAEAAAQASVAPAPSRPPAHITAATGRGPSRVNGVEVPEGGCQGEVGARLDSAGDQSARQFVNDLQRMSWDRSLQDSRVRAVFQAWSACMAEAGFFYRTPRDANNDPAFNTPKASPEEIRTAVADVRCKQTTNLVGIWSAADVGYQQQAVAANQGRLDGIARDIERRTAAAAALAPDNGR
jgi:hypothetical protein